MGRGGFAFEMSPVRNTDSFYLANGASEPYSAGRGENDDQFQYYARHPLPRVGAPKAHKQNSLREPSEQRPMAMTCRQCHGGTCMFQSPSSEPFCADCNLAALKK